MNTGKTWRINSTSSEQTERLGEQLGRSLKGGEVVELVSDLGGGKTTFVRGLARGFGSQDHVASPTFTISRVYRAGPRAIHHFDFYRLPEAGLAGEELADVIGDQQVITVVEWGGVVQEVLPPTRLKVSIARSGEESRELTFHYPSGLEYLVESMRP